MHKRIITIEEPVEYELKGINQIAVRPEIGLTFAMGLRHILRQDPNVDHGRWKFGDLENCRDRYSRRSDRSLWFSAPCIRMTRQVPSRV